MAHRHLILAYAAAFFFQFAYLGWIGLKYRALRRLEREFPPYAPEQQ
jgi:hypothetical protein